MMNGSNCSRTREWTVTGMDCGTCAALIKEAVARLPGVAGVEVGILSERLRLTLDAAQTSPDRIEAAARALGFQITPCTDAARRDFVRPAPPRNATPPGITTTLPPPPTVQVTAAPSTFTTTRPTGASPGTRPARGGW